MNELLTYYDIDWNKHLRLFNMIENLQVIFIIKKEDAVDCLQISENLFDITYSKILNLKNLGPFITLKKLTIDLDKNIEEGIINFFLKNKYYKWFGIIDSNISDNYYSINKFKHIIKPNNITYIIPHRNRNENLNVTIDNLNKYIKYNNLEADIWVIEQNNKTNWNKGATCNCGFDILKKHYKYFIINDADTYTKLDYKFNYPNENEIIHIFGYEYCLGGIFSCTKDTFLKINGFNNNFNNWGREDRDLEDRAKKNNIKINRSYLIKLNNTKAIQMKHENKNNYWNFDIKNNEYYKSRESYYFNQIEHFNKNYQNGLLSLKQGYVSNKEFIININLKNWTTGEIQIIDSNNNKIFIETFPDEDTGIILINSKLKIPINPSEKYPKISIKLDKENILLQTSYLQKLNLKNNLNLLDLNILYKNIDLDFDNIFTINNKYLNYNYYSLLSFNFYSLNVTF